MKPASLSLRLGLTVSLLGALLVVLLAVLAFFALSHELDSLSRSSLEKKMQQVEHSLSLYASSAEITSQPHMLLDQVTGHDNLSLSILDPQQPGRPLLQFGNGGSDPRQLSRIASRATANPAYARHIDEQDRQVLTLSKVFVLSSGAPLTVLLSMDGSHDEALLSAYLRSTLMALPLLLILIGFSAWAVVQRGLAPLRQFRQVAAMISAQDLGHRLSVVQMPQELSELAQGINFMLHRLDDGVQQLSQFSDDLAHELRSPITNLMGKAQVTLSRERPPEAYKAVLESCIEELERVNRIVSDMLFLAQVSHPAALVPFRSIALEDEALKVVDLFSLAAEDRQIRLKVTGSGQVQGDRLMIQRAISNLLSNALRHCPTGQAVAIEIEQAPSQVTLRVSNPGPGIEAQHLPHLFERFYRVDHSRARAQGGTGLGLAIVRSIMNLHQGSAEVQSSPGQVTVFSLKFSAPDGHAA